MRKGAVRFLLLLSLFAVMLAQPAAAGSSSWALYDNFNSGLLDPAKWTGQEEGNTIGRETLRTIILGKLYLMERSYGYTNSNAGVPWIQQKLWFTNGPNVKAIKASVRPTSFETVGCDNNPDPTWVAARLAGYFFNTGSAAPANGLNDVQALIGVNHFSNLDEDKNQSSVIAVVRQCIDAECNTFNTLYHETLGNLKMGQQGILSLEWDKDNHSFIFMFNKKTFTYSYNIEQYPDNFRSFYTGKRLDTSTQVSNCILTTQTDRPTAFISAIFDDVYIKTLSP
jgi:hypothetical protein